MTALPYSDDSIYAVTTENANCFKHAETILTMGFMYSHIPGEEFAVMGSTLNSPVGLAVTSGVWGTLYSPVGLAVTSGVCSTLYSPVGLAVTSGVCSTLNSPVGLALGKEYCADSETKLYHIKKMWRFDAMLLILGKHHLLPLVFNTAEGHLMLHVTVKQIVSDKTLQYLLLLQPKRMYWKERYLWMDLHVVCRKQTSVYDMLKPFNGNLLLTS